MRCAVLAVVGVWALLLGAEGARVVVEDVAGPPHYRRGAKVGAEEQLEFLIALRHSEKARAWLRETVEAVSTPTNPRYGKYVSREEITARMGAERGQIGEVVTALRQAGVAAEDMELVGSRDFLRVKATAGVASRVFGTDFCIWEPREGASGVGAGRMVRACETRYSLDEEVARHVDVVAGLVHFPHMQQRDVRSLKAKAGNDLATCRESYGTTDVKPKSGKSTACFTQFLEQWYSPRDLQAFEKKYSPDQEGQTIAKKIGPWKSGVGTEAELDAQYLVGMGHGVETWVWSNTHKNKVNNQEPWMEFFANVSSAAELPLVFSISYGELENTLTKDYMDRSDAELQKIAARGVTMMSASGDNGAGCSGGKYFANFPASLPHITSVGGTGQCGSGAGAAGFSSGGFSRSYKAPDYAAKAVAGYLNQTSILPDPSLYNASGRGYPDIAACGAVSICVEGMCGMGVEGTSCACPIAAGVVALLNDARLAAGKSSLGFLNPMLYKVWGDNPSTFNDVTTGQTEGCSFRAGWKAAKGWDPATGLGTPNYPELVKEVLKY